jgi:hypothetical protein
VESIYKEVRKLGASDSEIEGGAKFGGES